MVNMRANVSYYINRVANIIFMILWKLSPLSSLFYQNYTMFKIILWSYIELLVILYRAFGNDTMIYRDVSNGIIVITDDERE